MTTISSATTTWQAKAIEAARRDPKKAGALAALALLASIMIVRAIVAGGGGGAPKAASAASSSSSSTSLRTAKLREPAPGGSTSANAATQRPTNVIPSLQKWAEAAPAPISRNLFAVRMEYFPVDALRSGAGSNLTGDDGFWSRLEKSLTVQADQRNKRETQIANFKAKAAELKLQSTMMGPSPKAMVNGELVGEGDVVASFRVSRIEARRIIVEREGIRLEIQMK